MAEEKLLWEECHSIIGAAFAVHGKLGCGFLEAVYQEALSIEFSRREIPFEQQKELQIEYDGFVLNKKYYADFFCYDKIIVEIKAMDAISPAHEAQLLNYMKATKTRVGLLINFGEQNCKFRRLII